MRHLLFDLDDTLIDFKKAEHAAMPVLFENYGLPLNNSIRHRYREIFTELLTAHHAGEISREELQAKRFQDTFLHYGLVVNGETMDLEYRKMLADYVHVLPNIPKILDYLSEKYMLHIVTNGPVETQTKKIEASGLKHYFNEIFISRAIGYQKPDAKLYEHILSTIHANPNECCMIGDSLFADILGGNQVGMTTIWHNRYQYKNESGIIPTYEIHEMKQLLDLL